MTSLTKFEHAPQLDTLRFFAFLSVFIGHCILFLPPLCSTVCSTVLKKYFVTGDLGVSTFFILSGFLITILLLTEQNRLGDVKLKAFYIRRILRIWPLYAFIVFLGFVVVPHTVLHTVFGVPFTLYGTGSLWRFLTFTFNFAHKYHFVQYSLVLGVLWSISVEEQFYAFWPVVLKYVQRNKIPYILGGLIFASTVFRYMHAFDFDRATVEYNTFSVMSDIAIGSSCAFFYSHKKSLIESLSTSKTQAIGFVSFGIIFFDVLFRQTLLDTKLYVALEPLFFSFAVVGLLTLLLNERVPAWTKNKVLVYLGKVSYGLYMYHIVALILVLLLAPVLYLSSFATAVLSFVVTIVLATLSFEYFEKPILSLKKRFGNADSVGL